MKRLALMLVILSMLPIQVSTADISPLATPTPLPGYLLREIKEDIRVYAAANPKANIVGYISPESAPEVHLLEITGDWCLVSFSTAQGTSHGYIPFSCFDAIPEVTPTPVPDAVYAVGAQAWIVNAKEGYRLNLRAEPYATAKSLGKYFTGTPITLTGQIVNGYAQVLLAGTSLGWVDLRFITLDALGFVPEMPTLTIKNKGSGANLRSGPSTNYNRLGWFKHGSQITLMGVRNDGWCHVMVEDKVGFMSESLLSGTFPFDYGTDSDDPLLSGMLSDNETILYLNSRSNGGQVHLRKEASTTAKSLGLFFTGTPVTVVSHTRTGWVYVRIGHTEGYMAADYLTHIKPVQCGDTRVIRNASADGLNFRSIPSTGGEILGYLKNYTEVTVLGDLSDGWCYVLIDDQYGYMLGTSLKKAQ